MVANTFVLNQEWFSPKPVGPIQHMVCHFIFLMGLTMAPEIWWQGNNSTTSKLPNFWTYQEPQGLCTRSGAQHCADRA